MNKQRLISLIIKLCNMYSKYICISVYTHTHTFRHSTMTQWFHCYRNRNPEVKLRTISLSKTGAQCLHSEAHGNTCKRGLENTPLT